MLTPGPLEMCFFVEVSYNVNEVYCNRRPPAERSEAGGKKIFLVEYSL